MQSFDYAKPDWGIYKDQQLRPDDKVVAVIFDVTKRETFGAVYIHDENITEDIASVGWVDSGGNFVLVPWRPGLLLMCWYSCRIGLMHEIR